MILLFPLFNFYSSFSFWVNIQKEEEEEEEDTEAEEKVWFLCLMAYQPLLVI